MGRKSDTRTREEKFHESYTVAPNGCWEFHSVGTKGYGKFYYRYGHYGAHRVAWELYNGPIPDGLLVRHRCDNPPCANPEHLELGTEADNALDAVERRRTLTGERNKFAKLTESDIRFIRTAAESGTPLQDLAGRYGSLRNIRNIVNRKTWKHIA